MPHRDAIPPAPPGPRPLWSVMIPTWNCAGHLPATLRSVLAQDPGPDLMQIEVVDDHSTADDPESVVREVGGGRVGFVRQPANVGHVANFTTCLARARGHLVHLLHGDDLVLPGFYAALGPAFERHPDVGMAITRFRTIMARPDGSVFERDAPREQPRPGVLAGWLERIASGQRVQTPAVAVRRSVYECLGGFDRRLRTSEDWEMWVRIAAAAPVWYEPEVLAVYRMHAASSSSRAMRSGANVQDLRVASDIIMDHVPAAARGRTRRAARKAIAQFALQTARRALHVGDLATARAQAREAWRTDPALHTAVTMRTLAKPLARTLIRRSAARAGAAA